MSDGDTNDQTQNPFDGFSFSPDWAKGSAETNGANLRKYAARFEERGDRGDRGDRRGPRGERPFRGDRGPRRDRFEGDRGPRPFGDRPPRRDRFEGDRGPRPFGDRPPRRDRFEGDRGPRPFGDRPPRREWAEREPAPYSVRFLPDQKALTLAARKIAASRKAMPLREVVSLFFQNPDSTLVRVEWDEAHKEEKFHQCQACGWFAASEEELRNHLLAVHFPEFFETKEIEVDPPTGTFPAVARCGVTGRLIAPPNHHSFNRRVEEMLRLPECAGMTESEYRARIERVADPELVEQWRKEASKQTVFVLRTAKPDPAEAAKAADGAPAPSADAAPVDGAPAPSADAAPADETPAPPADAAPADETPAATEDAAPADETPAPPADAAPAPRTFTRDEAEALFLSEMAPKLERHGRQATASHAASTKISDPRLLAEIRRAWQHEQRIVFGPFFFAVRGGLRARKLAFFRAGEGRREEFVLHRAPSSLDASTAVPELRSILEFVGSHPGATRADLFAALAPEGTAPETAAAFHQQFEFAIDRAYLIEFVSGPLALPHGGPARADAEATPAAEEPAPVAEEPAPATEESTPATEAPAPASEESASATDEPAPVAEEPAPVAEETTPEAEEPAPATEEPAPADPNGP